MIEYITQKCTLEDAHLLADMDKEIFQEEAMNEEEWTKAINNLDLIAVYAKEQGTNKIVGIGVLSMAPIAYLYSNAVLPEYRKRGIGTTLIEKRIEYVNNSGLVVTKIQAHTKIDNYESQSLLRQFQFFPDQYETDYYDDGIDAIKWTLIK